MADYRMDWMRDRITKILGVQNHPEALEALIKENHEELQAFLDAEITDISDMGKCILYIYRTFYDRLVEREVVTIEKGEHQPFSPWSSNNLVPSIVNRYSSQNHDATAARSDRSSQGEERQEGKR